MMTFDMKELDYIFPIFGHSADVIGQGFVADGFFITAARVLTVDLAAYKDKTSEEILSYVDDLKVRSCMTLFDAVCPNNIFGEVLNQFYGGKRCQRTLRMLNRE